MLPNRLVIPFSILPRLLLNRPETVTLHTNILHTAYFVADSDVQALRNRIIQSQSPPEVIKLAEQSFEALLTLIQIIPDKKIPAEEGFSSDQFSLKVAMFLNCPLWQDDRLPEDASCAGVQYWRAESEKDHPVDDGEDKWP